jgi:hypothetical protein
MNRGGAVFSMREDSERSLREKWGKLVLILLIGGLRVVKIGDGRQMPSAPKRKSKMGSGRCRLQRH